MSQSHQHHTLRQRAIALAALTQSVHLVDSIARKGLADAEDCRTMIASLFQDPSTSEADIAQYYGGYDKLHIGLKLARAMLTGADLPQHKMLMTYSAGLLSLERKIAKDAAIRQTLGSGMQRITHQKLYFGDAMHSNIIAAIADLYGETVSTMTPRIIVKGKSAHLSQQANTRRVRALLMAGLRAAHLWHALGGSHINLMFRRKALIREMEILLEQ